MDVRERLESTLGDRYRVERRLGEGGMAVVFLARDLKHGRPVAIKVLRPELAAALGTDRFLREIEIAAQLNHPNILALHDSGEADGLLYFVMPFVEGESLRDRLRREGPMPVAEVVAVAREIGSALDYAHSRGLVHRDVKPENVLFQAGHALVCDFGIAKAASEARDGLTRTGMAVGTVAYMSPEQATGEADIDGRTDVYAMGCVVYEMLAGEGPFEGANAQAALTRKLMGAIPELTATRPGLPPTLEPVLAKAMAPERDERFPTPASFAEALVGATTEVAVERDRRRRRTGRLVRGAVATLGLAALAFGGWRVGEALRTPAIQRVAILPFSNEGGDPDQEFFVAGVHQDLILELARAGLRVINPNSVRGYAGSELPIRVIAEELQVDGVIQGSALHQADSVGVELTLVGAESEEVLWIESFGGRARDIVNLNRRMATAIADRIEAPLTPEARERLATVQEVDPQVYEWLLRARFHWQKLTEEGLSTALDYYDAVLERDSTSIEAWQGVANVWGIRVQEGLADRVFATARVDSALARARAVDPTFAGDPAGLALRKTWMEWSWEEAERAFLEALDRDPADSANRAYYALFLLYVGRPDEAEGQMERAAEDDPFNSLVQGLYAQGLNALGRHEDAERAMLRTLAREPEDPFALSTLRTTYHLMGREEEAMEMWRASYRRTGDLDAIEALDRGWAEGGYRAALRTVAELMVERSDTSYVRPWIIGTLYTRAGVVEEALDYLELAFEDHDSNIPYLTVDPIFDVLRDQPRFQILIDRLDLPEV